MCRNWLIMILPSSLFAKLPTTNPPLEHLAIMTWMHICCWLLDWQNPPSRNSRPSKRLLRRPAKEAKYLSRMSEILSRESRWRRYRNRRTWWQRLRNLAAGCIVSLCWRKIAMKSLVFSVNLGWLSFCGRMVEVSRLSISFIPNIWKTCDWGLSGWSVLSKSLWRMYEIYLRSI